MYWSFSVYYEIKNPFYRQNEIFGKKIWSSPKSDPKLTKKNLKFSLHFSTNFWLSYYGTHKDPSIGKLIIKNPFVYDFLYIFYDL